MEIRPLKDIVSEDILRQLAIIVNAAFPGEDGYPTLEEARSEVLESLDDERISLVAVNGPEVLGWIGAIPQYRGKSYELHPLVVRSDKRGLGVGTKLVYALEQALIELGAITLYLGTDDTDGRTSLYGQDVYPNPLQKAMQIENRGQHPLGFYQRLGYVVVGIMPDANGLGKPDIFMAKRLQLVK